VLESGLSPNRTSSAFGARLVERFARVGIAGTIDADLKSALLLDALETLLADVNYVMSSPPANQPDAVLVIWLHPRARLLNRALGDERPAVRSVAGEILRDADLK
jgi:hypothetical protein